MDKLNNPTPADDSSDEISQAQENRSGLKMPSLSSLKTADAWVGNYDYKELCMPRLPCLPRWRNSTSRSIFFGVNDKMPILLGILMGFQHALAMVVGVISVPRILGGAGLGHLNLDPSGRAYLISSGLVVSGLMSIIQIVRIKLVGRYRMGTGLISMSGTSFSFLPIAEATIKAVYDDGTCVPGEACPQAYGKWLGTAMVASLLEIVLSFLPANVLRNMFPPIVTGSTVFLIGASLIGVGLRYWAGGAGPCLNVKKIIDLAGPDAVPSGLAIFKDCPNIFGPGDRHYPWGAAQWIGLGFFVFVIIVIIEIFGSSFLRNVQVAIGLIAGIILSSALGYMDQSIIDQAPAFTFPLVKRFPLGIYLPALIPTLLTFLVSTVESVGDITASCEASKVETEGEEFESRIQGGLLADGVNSLLAGLLTSNPTTTFSQNNGVIAMTRTATPIAGIWASLWLILFGVLGKVGGVFVALPDAALGGMTTFLFAMVAVSGMKILSKLAWQRRDRFIMAITLAVGLGVIIEPKAFSFFIPEAKNDVVAGLRTGVVIILSTGYIIGALTCAILNWIIPKEEVEVNASEWSRTEGGKESA